MRITRRRLGYLLRPRPWWLLARTGIWELSPSVDVRPPLSWPIGDLGDVVVRWPSRYAWPNADGWLEPIRRGIVSHVRVIPFDIPQHEGNLVIFEIARGPSVARVGIDYDDTSELHPKRDGLDLYFKLQYARGGYGSPDVVPGGYVSPKLTLYRQARRWRRLRPTVDVYGRLGTQGANAEQRARILAAMQEQRSFSFGGGDGPRPWLEYMDELARSRISLDVPGRGDLCFRLVESLAVGTCVVGVELANELHVPVGDVREAAPEGELSGRCQALLDDELDRLDKARRGADFFDRYLQVEQLGAYYLHTCLSRS